jgi:hypothetical protein
MLSAFLGKLVLFCDESLLATGFDHWVGLMNKVLP